MTTWRTCSNCTHQFRPEDLTQYQKNANNSYSEACYKCITAWISEGFLWPIPFSERKQLELSETSRRN